jgi:hypothetical protein
VTDRASFTDEEWHTLLMGPPSAGTMVIMASSGGMFRETMAMAKAYAEERKSHGASELLDAIVAQKPQVDHTRFHSPDELREASLKHISAAVELLEQKATPAELEEYRTFVLAVCKRVAEAHREGDQTVSEGEQQAIDAIESVLGATA